MLSQFSQTKTTGIASKEVEIFKTSYQDEQEP